MQHTAGTIEKGRQVEKPEDQAEVKKTEVALPSYLRGFTGDEDELGVYSDTLCSSRLYFAACYIIYNLNFSPYRGEEEGREPWKEICH